MYSSVMTTFVKIVANLYCWIWYRLRCRLFRRIDDLSYHIFDLRDSYPSNYAYNSAMKGIPFFQKIIEWNNEYEKTVCIKIGSVCVRYSLEKTTKVSDLRIPSFATDAEIISEAIFSSPKKKLHHETFVVELKNYRMDSDDCDRQISR